MSVERPISVVWVCLFAQILPAQSISKVDFQRDVQPVFKANCYGCHGPTQQMNSLRLDRRRDAMRGGTLPVIAPGNSPASQLYLRLIGKGFGPQMPPTGPLPSRQVDTIKAWIDQGAVWPDEVSGEMPPAPPDPKATRMMEALRNGDARAFDRLLASDPKAANAKGPGGSTPLMYAALYGNADAVRLLLKNGANPNLRNDANATALMWALDDLEKTRLLLESGADVNARSDDGRTALMVAAGRHGASAVVKLLLDHRADPSAKSPYIFGERTPLAEAAYVSDDATVRTLIEHGADAKQAGYLALFYALRSGCGKCFELLAKSADRDTLNAAAAMVAPPLGDARAVTMLLDRGADPNAKDPKGNPLLVLASASDGLPLDTIRSLLDRGADVNAKNAEGKTALDLAKQRGATPVVDLLLKAGAKGSGTAEAVLKPQPAGSIRDAVQRSLPLLQRTDAIFLRKSGCVSCHNNVLESMAVAAARKKGFRVDEEESRNQVRKITTYLDGWRERALQDIGVPGDADTISYILLGLASQDWARDPATDALAHYLKTVQLTDGHWWPLGHRPPIESSDIEVTAASMRAMQVYAPKARRAEYEPAIQAAAGWLRKAQPRTTEDRAFQLLGLSWSGANPDVIRRAGRDLIAEQRLDGGWAQIPTLASDAYASGQALAALEESGALPVTDAAYQRGVRYLLNTQLADGSWHVKSRAMPIQPYFESDFPHGHDQWISAAATSWATMALAVAAPEPVHRAAR